MGVRILSWLAKAGKLNDLHKGKEGKRKGKIKAFKIMDVMSVGAWERPFRHGPIMKRTWNNWKQSTLWEQNGLWCATTWIGMSLKWSSIKGSTWHWRRQGCPQPCGGSGPNGSVMFSMWQEIRDDIVVLQGRAWVKEWDHFWGSVKWKFYLFLVKEFYVKVYVCCGLLQGGSHINVLNFDAKEKHFFMVFMESGYVAKIEI